MRSKPKKIVAISDGHGMLPDNLPEGDVLCIAGDICPVFNHDLFFQRQWIEGNFFDWCKNLLKDGVTKDIVFIAGNHDWRFEEIYEMGEEKAFQKILPDNVYYLRDSSVTIDGVKFYGTPWQPVFCNWAFNRYEGELDKLFEGIPEDTDVLLSHGPPHGNNDRVEGRGDHLGSKALMKHIRRAKPTWTLAGHIHTGDHTPTVLQLNVGNSKKLNSIVNVSLLDEQYHLSYEPFVFEI